ncbi:MAG: RHS repeat-associated core domain-containing protein, partial [Bacteroidales bacterium]|nr:RHS repeat-associated core domain-containing protein [Bacteroidales bacterium]
EIFTYDASDQLVSASETQAQSYQLAVTYGNWGKISGYSLAQTDLQSNTTTQASRSITYPTNTNSLGNSQTMFAPITQNGVEGVDFTFGINGSLRKREVQHPTQYTDYYLFNSAANLKAYSNNGLDFAYYGYNAANTRSYKLSMLNQNQWVNGQPEPLDLQFQQAMFYPNAYINFNHNGEYTKHYYNGSERICSRLGENTVSIAANSNDRLGFRIMQADQQARADLLEVVEAGDVPIETPSMDVTILQPANATSNIFYYHMNHLGSTAFVTDQNQNITQGFLYAPFGEITTEYAPLWQNGTLPKYAFNAKELDEETGMYYYEARYYKPPVFTSRDPMSEKYFWMTPYAYCANNPVKYVDPDGRKIIIRHWVSDGDQDGEYKPGHLNKEAAEQLENFAKTKEGFAFLSQYATKGQKIGSVEFTEDGIYAKHNLYILEFNNDGTVVEGRFSYSPENNKMNFYIHMNAAYLNEDFGKESYAINLGHEIFLHMDRIDDKLINALQSNNKADYFKVVKDDASNEKSGGKNDHSDYINGKSGGKFNRYVSQLKSIMNPANVDKAKIKHDSKYLHLRNK